MIEIKGLSKRFRVYDRPLDRLKEWLTPAGMSFHWAFWALRDIDLEIKKGSSLGIIGVNGAGKSTLLKILCGTLAPTFGSVEIRGRIAGLLELGSGFHQEFTGRQNIYLNARLLGLSDEDTKPGLNLIKFHFEEAASMISCVSIAIALKIFANSFMNAIFTSRCAFSIIFDASATLILGALWVPFSNTEL